MLNDSYIEIIKEKLKHVQDIELQQLVYMLIKENLSLQKISNIDPLTGLYNRRILDEIKTKILPRIVVMCDIDNFKTINDTYGHDKGDYVIKIIGQILKKNSRDTDYVLRYGGDEFLMAFIDCDYNFIYERCEKIKTEIANEVELAKYNVTISMGVFLNNGTEVLDELIKKADESLYRSKNNGKNMVSFYDESAYYTK